jgi:hypothetical protein
MKIYSRKFWFTLISFVFLVSCSNHSESFKLSEIPQSTQTLRTIELTSLDLSKYWQSPDTQTSPNCGGDLIKFVELLNARIEMRTVSNNVAEDTDPEEERYLRRENLCIFRKNSDQSLTKIADTLVESAGYTAVEKTDYGMNWSWYCSDNTHINLVEPQQSLRNIAISIERFRMCDGSAGFHYSLGFITFFVDALNPQMKNIVIPGFEITEQYEAALLNDANIRPINGNLYPTQSIDCYTSGCPTSTYAHVFDAKNGLLVSSTEVSISIPTFDPSIFAPNSYRTAGSPTDDPFVLSVHWNEE